MPVILKVYLQKILLFSFFLVHLLSIAQQNNDSLTISKEEPKKTADGDVVKTGINYIPLPDLRVDPYTGFRIGGVCYLYNFGDGARYPNFYSNTRLEASYGTKGVINLRVQHRKYGNKILFGEVYYLSQIAAPYFGVNGFMQSFNMDYIDRESPNPLSPKNPLFYNYSLKSLQINFEIQDTIKGTKCLNWLASLYSGWYDAGRADHQRFNKGVDPNSIDYISDTASTLYELNKKWGLADEKKLEGGNIYAIAKAELIYDKRDRITNPLKGVLSRVGISYSPQLKQGGYGNAIVLNASHTHYILVNKKDFFKTTFAYRFKYQGIFNGQLPYPVQDGIGGIKSAWGVHQNRAMVKQWASGQFELRTKGFTLRTKKTNFDFWGAPFFHTGYVIEEEKVDLSKVSATEKTIYFNNNYSRWYSSYGWMGKMVINKNIVLGFDIAFPVTSETGQPISIFVGLPFSYNF